jgi:hypothetical protein
VLRVGSDAERAGGGGDLLCECEVAVTERPVLLGHQADLQDA